MRADLPPHTSVRGESRLHLETKHDARLPGLTFCHPTSFRPVRPDAVLGHSSDARTFVALRGNPLRAIGRKLAGGPLIIHNIFARSQPADALLAPSRLGDVAVLNLVSLGRRQR